VKAYNIQTNKRFSFLNLLIEHHINKQLDDKQSLALYQDIGEYLALPTVNNFKLETTAIKVIQLGANYEAYISALLFKAMPDSFTRKELVNFEDEIIKYIEKDIYGKEIDKLFTQCLIQQTLKLVPDTTEKMAEKKAIGNWGWLIPYALTQLIIEAILNKIQMAILEDKKINRKGKIRIKNFK
jgi:hypothetical protein